MFKNIVKKVITAFLLLSSLKLQAVVVDPQIGVGIRGNGDFISAHWGALARIIESSSGIPGYAAGGSSASITIFALESALLNSHLSCTEEELQVNPLCEKEKLAFMVKSFEGYSEAFMEIIDVKKLMESLAIASDIANESSALYQRCSPGNINPEILEEFSLTNASSPLLKIKSDVEKLLGNIRGTQSNQFIKDVIGLDFLESFKSKLQILANIKTLKEFELETHKIRNIILHLQDSFSLLGKFDALSDDALFVRPGLLNFKNFGQLMGKMGNFYAGRGLELNPHLAEKFQTYFQECSKNTLGKSYEEFKDREVEGVSCHQRMLDLAKIYDNFLEKNRAQIKSREDDYPGETVPNFTPIISAGFIEDPKTIENWKKSYANLLNGEDKEKWDFQTKFDDVKFGYWVKRDKQEELKAKIAELCRDTFDFKLCHSEIIGAHPWKVILALSPAEPGMAPLQLFNDVLAHTGQSIHSSEKLSLAGWSDLLPHQILNAAGAEHTMIITRRGYEPPFAVGVMLRLGLSGITGDELKHTSAVIGAKNPNDPDYHRADDTFQAEPNRRTEGDWARGFNLHNPQSSYNRAILNAAVVACSDWNNGSSGDWKKLIRETYNSIFYVNNPEVFKATSSSISRVQLGETQDDLTINSGAKLVDLSSMEMTPDHPWFNRGCTGTLEYAENLPLQVSPFYR